jgi:hypothetical protein
VKPKALLIATALFALLGAGIWWSNRDIREKDAQPSKDAPPKVLALVESEIVKAEIRRAAGESTRLERDASGLWKLVEPAFPVDRDAVGALIASLSSLSSEKVVEEQAGDLAGFGLAQPGTQIVLTLKGGKTRTIALGDEAPVGGGSYVKVDGDARVFTVSSMTRTGIDKFAADLRDKRLLTFDGEKLARVEWTAKGSTIELAKTGGGDWAIVKPKPMRADGWQVEELLRKLREAKLDPLLTSDQMTDLAKQFTGSAPLASVALTDAAGTQRLEVRKNKEGKYYARSSVVEGFHMLQDDMGKNFDKTAEDLRNKKIFDFGFSDPGKVEYRDGSRQMVLSKAGDRWLSGTKPMDSVGVQSLIDRLRELSAVKFVDAGFTTAVVEITVTSKEGKLTEKAGLAKVGDKYLARREGEAGLYELEGKTVDELMAAAGSIKEQQAAAPAKK